MARYESRTVKEDAFHVKDLYRPNQVEIEIYGEGASIATIHTNLKNAKDLVKKLQERIEAGTKKKPNEEDYIKRYGLD